MFKQGFLIVLVVLVGTLNLRVEGQNTITAPPQMSRQEEFPEITYKHFSIDQAVERPKEIGKDFQGEGLKVNESGINDYKYMARFVLETENAPWLFGGAKEDEIQKTFSEMVDFAAAEFPIRLNFQQLFKTQWGKSIRFHSESNGEFSFEIYLPTGENKERAEVVMDGIFFNICKRGWPKVAQKRIEIAIMESESEIGALRIRLLHAEKELRDKENQAREQYGALSKDTRTILESRKWQLEVDQAGLEARMKMTEQMTKTTSKNEVRSELEMIKVNTQIELAGLLAQKDKINEILKLVTEYDKQIKPHMEQLHDIQAQMAEVEAMLQYENNRRMHLSQVQFKVKDNTVSIYPLKEKGK
ncbi:hypothetical protein ACFL02_02910 [Planctomycetota bacterium]